MHPVNIAVIGGSGLYNLDNLEIVEEVYPNTPWGYPSSKIIIGKIPSGLRIAFLARHGAHHQFSPSEVPARANIAALKSIGVKLILAFSAVGSLQEELAPTHFVLPNQIIDRTKGIRPSTYFEGEGIIGHASFADPFCPAAAEIIANHSHLVENLTVHKDKLLVCMEGPAFSTRAESNLYRSWGGGVINMSALPEAKLAREAEIAYQMICMSTDYDCWRESEEAVTADAVMKTMVTNASNAKKLLLAILEPLEQGIADGSVTKGVLGGMKYGIMSPPEACKSDKLHYILPEYFTKQ
ncbi:glutamate biosynthesis-related protein [Basidiobolus meristosporus CBS 931.73]|uniref:S-methyl-5'-thioadenosine phosphorylase n=1 Tax=Basidiobolus meristosporus CBS 931.73 TaxID=1314790 RepID=A0A1Y1XSW2_9FUNG|nr:glutamate biosynthesis-related protein [Basidiobolus meristosporus CBS 931.73]|eukprot:ORX88849.1 glutamate biosynthesis-related protein [Basidiobolus meristosporus CBS 931.73]